MTIDANDLDGRDAMQKQYERAIKARDALKDDYHKWMTYYYVANGAILVALTQLNRDNPGLIVLSIIGTGICVLWNLSCRGYYYWSINWIRIVNKMERKAFKKKEEFIYSVFSKQVAEEEKGRGVIKGANVSTPKLTMYLSFLSIICWAVCSIAFIYIIILNWLYCSWLSVISASIISMAYVILIRFGYLRLHKVATSRTENFHLLVDTRISNEEFE